MYPDGLIEINGQFFEGAIPYERLLKEIDLAQKKADLKQKQEQK